MYMESGLVGKEAAGFTSAVAVVMVFCKRMCGCAR